MVRIFMNQMLIDNVRILWIRIIQANKEQSYRFKKEWTQNNIITSSKVIQIVSRYLKYVLPHCPLLHRKMKNFETDAEKNIYSDFNKITLFRVLQLLV